jgi:hypothetical protein
VCALRPLDALVARSSCSRTRAVNEDFSMDIPP